MNQQLPLINRRQMEAIARAPRQQFEREVAGRARRFFPRLAGAMGDSALARLVGSSVADARAMGLSAASDLARHVYLTLVLEAGFQSRFDWAARILGSAGSPALRHRRLYCEAIDRLRRGLDPRALPDGPSEEEGQDDGD